MAYNLPPKQKFSLLLIHGSTIGDATKEPPQKVIKINTILANSKESRMSSKDKKRKIKEATVISQVLTSCLAIEEDYVIGFQKKCLIGLDLPHNDTLVISIQVAQAVIDRIHENKCNATNMLQLSVVQQMDMDAKINKFAKSLTGFNRATSVTLGTINLDVYSSLLISLQTFMIIEVISLHWHFGHTMDLQAQCNHFYHTPEHTLPSSFL